MPLILDGTTGIVANNIADYAISTAKLANSAVSTDKLANSAITTDKLANSSITSPKVGYAGAVLQVQHNVVATNYTGASASYVQVAAFNQTFTPLYSTSKVLVILSTGINLICDGMVALTRNGSIVKDTWFGSTRTDDQFDYPQTSGFYLDSPSTTSAVTYGIQVRASGCSNVIRIGGTDNHQSWTFMEIAA